MRFKVYLHRLRHDNLQVSRKLITLISGDGDIIGWTDYDKYCRVGKHKKSISITSDSGMRCFNVCKLLNYAFFGPYHVSKLTDITPEIVINYLRDYGLCQLPDDDDDTHRQEETVNICITHIIDFMEALIRDHPECKTRIEDLYRTDKVYDKRRHRYVEHKVPVFEVNFMPGGSPIYRDINDGAFRIILCHIRDHHPNLLMLAALGAFAGLRPSECCNVRRIDSALGPGIRFEMMDSAVINVAIDLTQELVLRSDGVSVGKIKKERTQKVYPAFLQAFMDCYNTYMSYIAGHPYETAYGALTCTSKGKAYTYAAYHAAFRKVIDECIPIMLASPDPSVVNYGHSLLEHNISPHIFRHWYSMRLALEPGMDVASLMHWRGDKSPESALTYLQDKSDLTAQLEATSNAATEYNLWRAEGTFGGSKDSND